MNDVFKLADKWASRMKGDPMPIIEQIVETYKNDILLQASVLKMIADRHKEFRSIIYSYLKINYYLIEGESSAEQRPTTFLLLQENVAENLDSIKRGLNGNESAEFIQEKIQTIIQLMRDYSDVIAADIAVDRMPDSGTDPIEEAIYPTIRDLLDTIAKLSDFITMSDQDKILEKMADFKNLSSKLEPQIQAFILNRF